MINPFKPAVLASLIWAVFAFVLVVQPAAAAPTFPALTGRVVDDAHILSPQAQAELTQELAGLEQKTSRQLVVVTLPSLQGYDIADYGYQLLRAWGIGQKQTNNGAVFIVAPNDRKVRVEVGYGLEGVLTDAISSVIIQREVLPRFRQKDMEGGVVAGTRALVEQLGLDTSTAEQRAAEARQQQQQIYAQQRAGRGHGNPIAGFVVFLVIVFVISTVLRGGGGGLGGFLGGMFLGSLLGGGRRYDDDRWGGGGGGWGGGGWSGGGGGFSGGGGSGGGGGSSGSW